ncbi:hypothetical protein N7447_004313 [Penicillium robsamsonii]|uniref:uncharacterized protein n=1 Tax=Penicillium robsamsonii TaxID=1792511 RepID=UPI002546E01C|nr:uncharacterized protein N7447_004313 [Penicillium robsamsonii]KAJ5827550.1 hypothetical protein N7447_004313 [Penicillium robsamsonii]
MRTRQKCLDYRVLNDESDGESLSEGQTYQSSELSESLSNLTRTILTCQEDAVILANIPDCELLPSESVSQVLVSQEGSTDAGSSITSHVSSRCSNRPAPATEWIWGYFETTAVDCPWVIKRTNKRRLVDRKICYEKTGTRCDWHTSDSQRQNTTSNMKTHLAKHGIYRPTLSIQPAKKGPDIRSFMGGKQSLTHQEVLERNAIRWIVTDMKAFTTVESPEFQQMFRDIPGIEPSFTSRHTLRDRIMQEFAIQRTNLKNELALTCKTIVLSLDIRTSQNHLPILGIIGHWLTDEFEYCSRIVSLIDLQSISVLPAFLQARWPVFLKPPQNYDYKKGIFEVKLRDDFDTLDEDNKIHAMREWSQAKLAKADEIPTLLEDKPAHRAMNVPRVFRELFLRCGEVSEIGVLPLRACLIELFQNWSDLGFSGECPLSFTQEQVDTHDR